MASNDTSTPPIVEPSTTPDQSSTVVTSDTSTVDTSTTSSAPPTSDTSSAPTTSSPSSAPTSSAPTSSPASSAEASSQQGSSAGQTSSAAPGSSAASSNAASSASTTAAASSTRSQVVETSYVLTTVTDNSGNVVTQSAPVTRTSSVDVPANGGSSGGSSNTGAIVGGVVGGVVGLILIIGALWFFLRKRRRSHRDDFDDGMFDPSRAQNHAPVDLADSGPNTVEPFYTPGVASTAQSPQMTQYPGSASATSEGYGAQGLSRGPSTATSAGYAGQGAGFGTMQMPEPHVGGGAGGYGAAAAAGAAGAGAGAMAGMSSKQREAYQERQNNRVGGPAAMPQQYGGASGSGPAPMSPSSTSDGPVTVAEDGGAYHDASPVGNEVPPTYDSIRK